MKMIKSFKDKEAERIWDQFYIKKFPHDVQETGLRKLFMIQHSKCLGDLKIPPANMLKKLKGDRKGQYSIRINKQFRICFEWKDSNAYNVEITDYH